MPTSDQPLQRLVTCSNKDTGTVNGALLRDAAPHAAIDYRTVSTSHAHCAIIHSMHRRPRTTVYILTVSPDVFIQRAGYPKLLTPST
ncbi:hypothetical protein DPX16_18329 [Anabarilius grahami]|uniref:Uncharacterized protein n=1 Tax=Anabarilius grahami TaxID=495550 RepID=A0A3N0YFR2_ANAGA|nr:hypothetical protein DPX16_18329 [Anabarilius grahami]